MTHAEIMELLANPPKPDIEGLKKEMLKSDLLMSSKNAEKIENWCAASTDTSARPMIFRRENPEGKGTSRKVYDAYNFYGISRTKETRDLIRETVAKAAIEAFQASLPASDKLKKTNWEAFRGTFRINMFLPHTSQRHAEMESLNGEWLPLTSKFRPTVNEAETFKVSDRFLVGLIEGDAKHLLLAKYGFQDIVWTDRSACFVKLPRKAVLSLIRGSFLPSCTSGPALVKTSGDMEYLVRGVRFNTKNLDGSPNDDLIERLIDPVTGFVKISIAQVLSMPNAEQRRVLLEIINSDDHERERLLTELKPMPIDGPTEAGNTLYSVDLGIPPQYRPASKELGDDITGDDKLDAWKARKNLTLMLKYDCPSTGRTYTKFVPPYFRSADEAQAWSHHFTMDEYLNIKAQA